MYRQTLFAVRDGRDLYPFALDTDTYVNVAFYGGGA